MIHVWPFSTNFLLIRIGLDQLRQPYDYDHHKVLEDCHNYHREKAGLPPLRYLEELGDVRVRRVDWVWDIIERLRDPPAFNSEGKFTPEPPTHTPNSHPQLF